MDKYPALRAALDYCDEMGIEPPVNLLVEIARVLRPKRAYKALRDYDNLLTRLVSIYLNELRTKPLNEIGDFGIDFANAVEEGLNEAWRAGMRENNVEEMLPEWQDVLDGIIAEERSHIPDFAAYLTEAANTAESMGAAITQVQARLDMWIQRYQDVREQAVRESQDETTKEEWVIDPEKENCVTCAALNGIVAYAREWDEAGFHPRDFPNPMLECTGAHCGCERRPTDKRRTPNALDRLLDLAASGGI